MVGAGRNHRAPCVQPIVPVLARLSGQALPRAVACSRHETALLRRRRHRHRLAPPRRARRLEPAARLRHVPGLQGPPGAQLAAAAARDARRRRRRARPRAPRPQRLAAAPREGGLSRAGLCVARHARPCRGAAARQRAPAGGGRAARQPLRLLEAREGAAAVHHGRREARDREDRTARARARARDRPRARVAHARGPPARRLRGDASCRQRDARLFGRPRPQRRPADAAARAPAARRRAARRVDLRRPRAPAR